MPEFFFIFCCVGKIHTLKDRTRVSIHYHHITRRRKDTTEINQSADILRWSIFEAVLTDSLRSNSQVCLGICKVSA